MANRARSHNHRNHLKQLKINRAKEKYNHSMMILNANADKIRESAKENSNKEGETN